MPSRLNDTSPEAERVQFDLLRELPFWRSVQLLDDLIEMGRELCLAGLRARFPGASPEEYQRRLASMLLGPELATKVYGPEPDPPTLQ
jgi:hypothetical protein